MDLKLQGNKALITGASKGIGAVIARRLAEEDVTSLSPPVRRPNQRTRRRGYAPRRDELWRSKWSTSPMVIN
jgi:NAD(P)-dependent dehydrogenase (short-subunit alcohol dehydrogenase family)